MNINVKRIIVKANNKDIITHQITNVVQCKLCYDILIDPHDCQCCLQTFCGNCIESYIKSNNHCPFTEFFSENPFPKSPLSLLKKSSSNITQLISSLKFRCNNRSNGCNAELAIDNLTEHDKKCVINKANIHSNNALKNQNALMETPPQSYKLQGKEMSFRKVDKVHGQDDDSLVINCPGGYGNNNNDYIQKTLIEKVDKIYDILNTFIHHNKNFEYTPKFDKSNFSSSSSSSSPIDQLSNKSGSNETLNNIANELTCLNKKISSIESKITPFNSTENSSSSQAKSTQHNHAKEKTVSMFDSSLNIISIGSHYEKNNVNTTNTSIALNANNNNSSGRSGRSSSRILNLKQNCASKVNKLKTQMKAMKTFDSSSMNNNKELKQRTINASPPTNESKKNSSLISIPEHVNELNSQLIKQEILSHINEKCNKEIKQYILELTLDNSNLFVQKIDEVLEKIASSNSTQKQAIA